jgi:hypothetical protein
MASNGNSLQHLAMERDDGGSVYVFCGQDKAVVGGKELPGLSLKGEHSAKDGLVAGVLAAETVAACGESLSENGV